MNFGDALAELKQRKVLRLAVIYAVVGWIVIEAADVIFPALLLPEWTLRLLVVFVLLGFPIALVLSWMFDLTPGGVKRTRREEEEEDAAAGAVGRRSATAADASLDSAGAAARPGTQDAAPRAEADPPPSVLGGESDTARRPGATSVPTHGPEAGLPTDSAVGAKPPSQAPTTPAPASEPAAGPRTAERSIAVLPFVNMSDDKDNEYFSDGMTEEILNALAKVRELRVASRTSSFAFKGEESDVLEIARKLRVGTVVEGSVRKAGNRIRVTAQLISAEDGYHLWSDSYDRELEDVFQVQDEIALSIVEALKVELTGGEEEHLVEPETQDVEAYTLYLKGRFLFNHYREADLKRSLDLYADALDHDPGYARAYAGIADTWMQLADDWAPPEEAYPEARRAAEKAIELDPTLAEAHTAVGKVLGWFEWDFDQAELALRRAVGANRKYGDAHWGLGSILPTTGQLDEAVEEMRLAVSLDPLSPVFNYWLSRFLYFQRELGEAMDEAHQSIELDPSSFRPRLILGLCHLLRDEPEEAMAAFQANAVSDMTSGGTFVARAHAAAGRPDEAARILEGLEEGDEYVRSEYLAAGWAALGELDHAFAALEQAYSDRSAGLIYLHVDPSYDPLRDDPRYASLVERIGLEAG